MDNREKVKALFDSKTNKAYSTPLGYFIALFAISGVSGIVGMAPLIIEKFITGLWKKKDSKETEEFEKQRDNWFEEIAENTHGSELVLERIAIMLESALKKDPAIQDEVNNLLEMAYKDKDFIGVIKSDSQFAQDLHNTMKILSEEIPRLGVKLDAIGESMVDLIEVSREGIQYQKEMVLYQKDIRNILSTISGKESKDVFRNADNSTSISYDAAESIQVGSSMGHLIFFSDALHDKKGLDEGWSGPYPRIILNILTDVISALENESIIGPKHKHESCILPGFTSDLSELRMLTSCVYDQKGSAYYRIPSQIKTLEHMTRIKIRKNLGRLCELGYLIFLQYGIADMARLCCHIERRGMELPEIQKYLKFQSLSVQTKNRIEANFKEIESNNALEASKLLHEFIDSIFIEEKPYDNTDYNRLADIYWSMVRESISDQ